MRGDHVPPISHFEFANDESGFHAEFLSPLRGSGLRRDGSPDATESAAGVTTQKLRHLDALLVVPWELHLTERGTIPVAVDCTIQVANPVSFIVQKLLIHQVRTPQKRSQDILYIHDTIELFAGALDRLHETWVVHVAPSLTQKVRADVHLIATALFRSVTDDLRTAARIPADRRLGAEDVRRRCRLGCEIMLDG